MIGKRRCVNLVSTEDFGIFCQGEISERGGDSWCDLWDDHCGVSDCASGTGTNGPVVPVVTDVLVSLSSVVAEVCHCFSLGSDWEFVEPQSFAFPKKRSFMRAENQRDELRRVASESRRMMPPTTQQISFSSTDGSQWQADLEAQRSIWSTRERRVIAATENYLDISADMKAEFEMLELLMDPEDSEVCLRRILTDSRKRCSRIFDIFSTKENSDRSVASKNRWLEHQEKRVAQRERLQSEWQDVKHDGTMAKAPPCTERRMRTPLPQQSSPSTLEEESPWSARERTAMART